MNSKGIFGEIIAGGHHQLTQGFYDHGKPIAFSYDFHDLEISANIPQLEDQIRDIIRWLKIEDGDIRKHLVKELDSKFAEDYLEGYFETVTTEEYGLWFVDYNRILGRLYEDYYLNNTSHRAPSAKNEIKGLIGCRGKATGRARIVTDLDGVEMNKDDILVVPMTTPDHLMLMKSAKAIVTDLGGMLSHAAIIAREFSIPCVVGTDNATTFFKEGDLIEVDGDKGTVKKI